MTDCNDHQHCIDEALIKAEAICGAQGAKLTTLRRHVLLLIWQNHKPLGAYTLIDMLADTEKRRVAPPTVYRALEFLLELGLIHRINSLNAYIGCTNPDLHLDPQGLSTNYFLICNQCQDSQEIIDATLADNISEVSGHTGFKAQKQWLEVTGLCEKCAQ